MHSETSSWGCPGQGSGGTAVWQPTLDPTGQTNQGQGKQAMVVELTHRVPTTCKSPTCTPKQPQRSALGMAILAQPTKGAVWWPTLDPTGQIYQGQGKQAMVVLLPHRVPTTCKSPTCTSIQPQRSALGMATPGTANQGGGAVDNLGPSRANQPRTGQASHGC